MIDFLIYFLVAGVGGICGSWVMDKIQSRREKRRRRYDGDYFIGKRNY